MACSTGSGANAIFTMFTVVQLFFGIGVGGEYPVASTSANERAENTKHLQNRRGETVVCVFSMQGEWVGDGLQLSPSSLTFAAACFADQLSSHCPCDPAGWGNLANTIVILSLLAMFNQYGPKYK